MVRDTRLVTRAVVIAACLLLVAAVPAFARTRVSALAYDITDASISEEMDFQGDGGPACSRAGVCGYSGTVTYGFDGIEGGDAFIAFLRRGHRTRTIASGEIFANGLTKATVFGPGGGPPCTEQILRHGELFSIAGTPGRVRFSFHDPSVTGSLLRTYCTGPSDADMWRARAIPRLSVPVSTLRHRHVLLQTSTTRPFHSGPFVGQLKFSVSLRMRRVRIPSFFLQLL